MSGNPNQTSSEVFSDSHSGAVTVTEVFSGIGEEGAEEDAWH